MKKNWKKSLSLVLGLMLVVAVMVGAGVFGRANYEAGVSNVVYFTDVDSNVTYTSDWFDATILDGQTAYLNLYYKAGVTQTAGDTLKSLVIEGRMNSGSSTHSNLLIDSVDNVARAWGTAIAPMQRIHATTTGAITHITLTPTNFYPQWRYKVVGDCANSLLVIGLYARVNDYMPPRFSDGK